MDLIIMRLSPSSCTLFPLKTKHPRQHVIRQHQTPSFTTI